MNEVSLASHLRVGNSMRSFPDRIVALLLALFAVCGAVTSPVCKQAQSADVSALHRTYVATQGMQGASSTPSCADPCCEHARKVPARLRNDACGPHCLVTATASLQNAAAPSQAFAMVPVERKTAEPLVNLRAARTIVTRRVAEPPLSFAVPLRI